MKFSVLMAVYCGSDPLFLDEAIRSIWEEQRLKPNQIVLVKDGPLTDELEKIITKWLGSLGQALELVALDENVGLGAALNEGLKYCSYDLVARMDSDDISLPERFEQQVKFMEMNPEVVASSAVLEEWDISMTQRLGVRNLPAEPLILARFAKRRSPLSHPVAIFRKKVIISVGGYPNLRKAQDYGLWSVLLVKGYKLANLPLVLLRMRAGNEMFSRRGWQYFKEEYRLLKYQKEIKFLSASDFYINVILKATLRSAPRSIKALAYQFGR